MPKKPVLRDDQIIKCLRDDYELNVEKISFLPLGADLNTSVYRVVTADKASYFVKVQKGDFNEASVTIPNFLSTLGIQQVIPSLPTKSGQLWAVLDPFKVILYPFVEGHPAFDGHMSRQQWLEYGAALKRFHSADIPSYMTSSIRKDNFSPFWRDTLKMILDRIEQEAFAEPVAIELVDFLKSKKNELIEMVQRTEQLAQMILQQLPKFVLCHSDLHGWNLLVDNDGALYIIDWDWLIFAPKERDLMFIGGGHGDSGYTPQEEETMFYQGYGQTNVDRVSIAYYRFERIIVDMMDECDLIFLSEQGLETQKEALTDIKSMFLPNGKIEMAYRSNQVDKKN